MKIVPLRLRSVVSGFLTRCPQCHRGRMFRSFFRMHHACPRCAYDFGLGEGEFTGAMMMAQFLWGGLGLYAWFLLPQVQTPDPLGIALWLAFFGAALPLVSYRNIKGLWAGIIFAGEELEKPGVRQRGPPIGQR